MVLPGRCYGDEKETEASYVAYEHGEQEQQVQTPEVGTGLACCITAGRTLEKQELWVEEVWSCSVNGWQCH